MRTEACSSIVRLHRLFDLFQIHIAENNKWFGKATLWIETNIYIMELNKLCGVSVYLKSEKDRIWSKNSGYIPENVEYLPLTVVIIGKDIIWSSKFGCLSENVRCLPLVVARKVSEAHGSNLSYSDLYRSV